MMDRLETGARLLDRIERMFVDCGMDNGERDDGVQPEEPHPRRPSAATPLRRPWHPAVRHTEPTAGDGVRVWLEDQPGSDENLADQSGIAAL
jgi:hypothetical protein